MFYLADDGGMDAADEYLLYSASLVRRPMATQCGASGFMFGVGDIIAQQAFEKKGKDHDVRVFAIFYDLS